MSTTPSNFRVTIEEWVNPQGAHCDLLRNTWARIGINIGDVCLTEFYDTEAKSVRKATYGPAYPLAHWLALHWWSLANEVERPSKTILERHNIKAAREGFALPDVTLYPQGDHIKASWKPFAPKSMNGRFITEAGNTTMPMREFKKAAREFIEKTIRRLEDTNVKESPLHSVWNETLNSEKDPGERDFCVIAGKLGLDPYETQEWQVQQITESYEILPEELRSEFFHAAQPNRLLETAKKLALIIQGIDNKTWHKPQLPEFTLSPNMPPWASGYSIAQTVKVSGETVPITLKTADLGSLSGLACFDTSNKGITLFAPTTKTTATQEFLKARATCEYYTQTAPFALLTQAKTPRQATNRAFAAELLAPARTIREKFEQGFTSEEIADELGVSISTIQYQQENQLV